MSETEEPKAEAIEAQAQSDPAKLEEALTLAAGGAAFNAPFFIRDLPVLIKQRCPDPTVAMPRVFVHVAGGDVLQVASILGLTPRWLALAVHTDDGVRTEALPYALIGRVVIEAAKPNDAGARIGFRQERKPDVLTT